MPYLQLSVLSHHPEFAEEILLAQGAQSVSFFDGADNPVLEPAPGETPLWPRTRTVGLFAAGVDAAPVIAVLRELLPDGDGAMTSTEVLDDQDWVKLWLRDWVPLKFGQRLWVCPHEKAVHEQGAVTVLLDPGLAFGTGTHPSTALCLEWLAGAAPGASAGDLKSFSMTPAADLAGKTVLDYGCGSGLLAIAALKLGAAHATAVDLDPQALLATRENAQQNAVADCLRILEPEQLNTGAFDVVLANILAKPLIELAPRLCGFLKPGGRLVLAGLLDWQVEDVSAAYRGMLKMEPPLLKEGWARLTAQKIIRRRIRKF